jgi:four helix bundle protein
MMQEFDREKVLTFTDLNAWKECHKLVVATYSATETFPVSEQFGLTNQARRAAVSITSNIAEGISRVTYKDKTHFYRIALGSLTEVQNQLLIARDVEYIEQNVFTDISEITILVSNLLNGLIKATSSQAAMHDS